ANNIDYLTVTGRTKDKKSALEKINRKSYKNPKSQMTDLSGIRIILYFESDINKVSELISDSFDIDFDNSLDKSKVLSKDQIGYRSVHYVCTLGQGRSNLPEYLELGELKFEVQVRTILQHAWAELAHDSSYKFSGTLPPEIERKLYLYAGMLEIADKGFDEISAQIDSYKKSVDE
nr:GTP pyrophosphokinase [Photobacterium lucens]